jgi:biopolymer transport protein ExbB/TolQ
MEAAAAANAAQHQSAVVFALSNMTYEGMVTMTLLALMSLISWTVIVGKALSLRKAQRLAGKFYEEFWNLSDPFELVGKDKEYDGAPPYTVYDEGCREMQKQLDRFAPKEKANGSRRVPPRALAAVRAAMVRGIGDEGVRMNGGLVILALAISGGPFIGLTGTVFGVMETFAGVAQAGSATLSAMAPGVAGALINTVVGLIVAIPALFAFNMLTTRVGSLSLDMENFSKELEATFTIDYVQTSDVGSEGSSKTAPRTHDELANATH